MAQHKKKMPHLSQAEQATLRSRLVQSWTGKKSQDITLWKQCGYDRKIKKNFEIDSTLKWASSGSTKQVTPGLGPAQDARQRSTYGIFWRLGIYSYEQRTLRVQAVRVRQGGLKRTHIYNIYTLYIFVGFRVFHVWVFQYVFATRLVQTIEQNMSE